MLVENSRCVSGCLVIYIFLSPFRAQVSLGWLFLGYLVDIFGMAIVLLAGWRVWPRVPEQDEQNYNWYWIAIIIGIEDNRRSD